MTKILIACSVALLTGCMTVPVEDKNKLVTQQQATMVLDDNCASIAKYVRAIALARDTGIAPSDAKIIARGPSVFPVDQIIRDVYSRPDMDPAKSAVNVYDVCVQTSYLKLVAALHQAEIRYQNSETASLTKMVADISASESLSKSGGLALRLDTQLMTQPKKKK